MTDIAVTLTSKRHLAGVQAAYAASIPADPETPAPYASAEEYAQAAFERAADSWADTTHVDKISVGDFILRFTGAEYSAITTSNDPNVAAILATLRARADVRLGSADAINGLAYLVSAGFVTAERADAILDY